MVSRRPRTLTAPEDSAATLLQRPRGAEKRRHLKHPRPPRNARTDLTRVRGPPRGAGALKLGKRGAALRYGSGLHGHEPSQRTRPRTAPRRAVHGEAAAKQALTPHLQQSRRHGGRSTNHLFGSLEVKPPLVLPLPLSDLNKTKRVISTSKLGPRNS